MIEDEEDEEYVELSDYDYLRDLAERLRNVPVMYGIDGYDIDHLPIVAENIKLRKQIEELLS